MMKLKLYYWRFDFLIHFFVERKVNYALQLTHGIYAKKWLNSFSVKIGFKIPQSKKKFNLLIQFFLIRLILKKSQSFLLIDVSNCLLAMFIHLN